jgi:hypothetical protein
MYKSTQNITERLGKLDSTANVGGVNSVLLFSEMVLLDYNGYFNASNAKGKRLYFVLIQNH